MVRAAVQSGLSVYLCTVIFLFAAGCLVLLLRGDFTEAFEVRDRHLNSWDRRVPTSRFI